MAVDRLTEHDWRHCYLLPEYVSTNIDRRGSEGGPGAHEYARGVLVEICRATGAHPASLPYAEIEHRDGLLQVITATAALRGGHPLTVITRIHSRATADRDNDWSITVDGVDLPAESRRYPPSPPFQGHLVSYHLT